MTKRISIEEIESLSFVKSEQMREKILLPENSDFKERLVKVMTIIFVKRSYLDFARTKKEIDDIGDINIFGVRFEHPGYIPDSDPVAYYQIINKLDTFRSRTSSLLSSAQSDMEWMDSYYDHLCKAWASMCSQLRSDQKRMSEAETVLYFLLPEKLRRRELFNIVRNKFFSLGAKMEAVSRKISLYMHEGKNFPGSTMEFSPEEDRSDKEKSEKKGWDAVEKTGN